MGENKKSFLDRLLTHRLFRHLFKFINNVIEDKLSAFSSEAALFTIMSFFPFLMLFFVILSFTSLTPEFIFRLVKDSFPAELIQLIMTVVVQLNNTSKTVITITILTALWTSSRGFVAIEKGFNVVYKASHRKNFIINRLFGLSYTLGFAILLILTLMLLGFGNSIYIAIIKHFKFIKDLAILIMGMRAIVLFVLLFFFFVIMYIVLPNRKSSLILEAPGAILASIGWISFSKAFSFYIDNIANFSIIYGSLTTIVLLLLWVYFCMYILFLGAEVNHYLRTYLQNRINEKGPNSKLAKLKAIIFKDKKN
ncbi:MAG: YihY/virulence factor BrkB family protein [Lachnospiraceae bacterium]|nr:YihY/virulence factor BrkB family protein [Lachnospiraceae bacterium]